ncbi:MAG: YafY family transcriptional regulator [Eubacteriales bacterium]|nr:YafY family transcriptional regulator [Eubacteriales bacterium]
MKNDRLFQIVYLLLDKGTITAPELARALEVSVRTIYRDIDALSIAGVPVFASQGKNGGISLMPNYAFDKALLSDDEQNQILFAIQSLKATDQPVDALLNKLGGLFQKQNANWIEVDFSRWGMGNTDSRKFEQLKTALIGKHPLEIVYCSSSGETNRRVILPLKLIFKDKGWYLQAYCRMAEDFRLFKVNRIVELTVQNERFADLPDDPPPLEPNYMTEPGYTRILLRFSPAIAFRIYDEFDRSSIAPQPDGSLLVTAYFPQDGWVVGYLHSFGADVSILEPAEMREYVASYAKAIWEHHQKELE